MRVFRLPFSPNWLLLPILCLSLFFGQLFWREIYAELEAMAPALFGHSILIDPGHGGFDPGVIGVNGAKEAEINLAISKKLEEYCRQGGMTVMLSRSSDQALAERKQADMEARVRLAQTADVVVSLHCNSYLGNSSQRGAQVFYHSGNAEGQRLAQAVQACFQRELGNTERTALAHPNSYLLRQIDAPAIIAEMGFLSNPEEEALLQDESYQWEVAWSIYQALNDFFLEEETAAEISTKSLLPE